MLFGGAAFLCKLPICDVNGSIHHGADRGLQPRDVGLERDGHPVAEAALQARANGAEKPSPGSRQAEADSRAGSQAWPVLEDGFAEQRDP